MILLTGGSGLLGKHLQGLMQWQAIDFVAPSHQDFDITKPLVLIDIDWVIHCAAATGVAKGEAEDQRAAFHRVNVEGTRNLVDACRRAGVGMTYISTDYVFDGDRGGYRPDDPPNPINYYALTKLLGEECVRTLPDWQIIRTSFKRSVWPTKGAFTDLITNADFVDVIAPLVLKAVMDRRPREIRHVGTEAKSIFDLARRRNPDVQPMSIKDITAVRLPRNITIL